MRKTYKKRKRTSLEKRKKQLRLHLILLLCVVLFGLLLAALVMFLQDREGTKPAETPSQSTRPDEEKPPETEEEQEEPAEAAAPPSFAANLQETDIYTFMQGPKAWSTKADWSGSWCDEELKDQRFSVFGCGLCVLANIYSTFTDYDCSPLDMYYYAQEVSGYTPVSGIGAIDWPYMQQTLKSTGISSRLGQKEESYEEFRESAAGAGTVIALISSYSDDAYWHDVEGHYVTLWLYEREDDTVFLGDSGNPEHNRQRIPLRYVYDALKMGTEYQYLAVTDVDPEANSWKHNGIHIVWKQPEYYHPKGEGSAAAEETAITELNRLSFPPYAKVRTYFTGETVPGYIRYVQQNPGAGADGDFFYSDYWSPLETGKSECYSASVSMALSYIGINQTAGTIVSEGRLIEQPGAVKLSPSFKEGLEQYENGCGTYSPVILHIVPYAGRSAGNEHWVVVAGKVSENTYRILDPTHSEHGYMWDGVIEGDRLSYWDGCTDTIFEIYQYKIQEE